MTYKKDWKNWACLHYQTKPEVDQLILKQVKMTVMYYSPLSSKYTEESKLFYLQSAGLELNTRNKLSKYKQSKIQEHITKWRLWKPQYGSVQWQIRNT